MNAEHITGKGRSFTSFGPEFASRRKHLNHIHSNAIRRLPDACNGSFESARHGAVRGAVRGCPAVLRHLDTGSIGIATRYPGSPQGQHIADGRPGWRSQRRD